MGGRGRTANKSLGFEGEVWDILGFWICDFLANECRVLYSDMAGHGECRRMNVMYMTECVRPIFAKF